MAIRARTRRNRESVFGLAPGFINLVSEYQVVSAVPQGMHLGPTMSTLLINDIKNAVQ